MYWTVDSMNNLLSYCGLVELRISASEKDLPVIMVADKFETHVDWGIENLPRWQNWENIWLSR